MRRFKTLFLLLSATLMLSTCADDVQILQLHPLLFQLPLTGLEFCDLGGVLLILVVDLLDFRIRFSSLL